MGGPAAATVKVTLVPTRAEAPVGCWRICVAWGRTVKVMVAEAWPPVLTPRIV